MSFNQFDLVGAYPYTLEPDETLTVSNMQINGEHAVACLFRLSSLLILCRELMF